MEQQPQDKNGTREENKEKTHEDIKEQNDDAKNFQTFFEKVKSFRLHLNDDSGTKATRNNYQLGRRIFHFANGAIIATMYNAFLSHKQIVYILGLTASLLYVFEQLRISYPELSSRMKWANKLLLRAEEQLKESAAVPYAMALLLTIITFPKEIALIAIYTLSLADPLSALVGISIGKHKIAKNKSLEGSAAFFVATTLCSYTVLIHYHPGMIAPSIKISILVGIFGTLAEIIPIRIDDNLTIPLFIALISWVICSLFGLPIGHV